MDERPMVTRPGSIEGQLEKIIVGVLRAPVMVAAVFESVRDGLAEEEANVAATQAEYDLDVSREDKGSRA